MCKQEWKILLRVFQKARGKLCLCVSVCVSHNVCIAMERLHMMRSCPTCIPARGCERVCIRLHYAARIRLREAQVWLCGCNQASFSSADSSFTLTVWSQLLHEQPIYYCCLATWSSLESFGPLSEITTRTLSLQNHRGECDSPDTTSSLFSSPVETIFRAESLL